MNSSYFKFTSLVLSPRLILRHCWLVRVKGVVGFVSLMLFWTDVGKVFFWTKVDCDYFSTNIINVILPSL